MLVEGYRREYALFAGRTLFSGFQRSLDVAPNILAKRLEGFVVGGIMKKHPHGPHPHHREFELTPMGLDLKPVVIALTEGGIAGWLPRARRSSTSTKGCGGRVEVHLQCRTCGKEPTLDEVITTPTARGRAWMKERIRSKERGR